jgi:hypothetical protein
MKRATTLRDASDKIVYQRCPTCKKYDGFQHMDTKPFCHKLEKKKKLKNGTTTEQ